jgi:hypothetical protein
MTRRPVLPEIALIGLLCFLVYAPALSIPLLEDDYPNLAYAQLKGSPAGVPGLLHDPIFRVRATSCWLMFGLWKAFGLAPGVFHGASLMLHFANCCLVYAITRLRWASAAFWTAAFFAVEEGHQEAIMWFSASNELLVFLFGAGSLVCWLLAGREGAPGARRRALAVASIVAFGLALVSKESAVIWLPLFLLGGANFSLPKREGWLKPAPLIRLLPHAALAALAVAAVWSTRGYSFRFSDGSFSLTAPFWITWTRGCARLLWVWGWLALAAVAWRRDSELWKQALVAMAWMGIGLAPYSFLTYSAQIPSRQTYVASAGLAFLFGLGMTRLRAIPGAARRLAAVAAVAMVVSNAGYLWTKKRAQFLERAEPTEQLIRLARQTAGPIWVRCFPRNRYIAEEAVHVGAGRSPGMLVWSQAEAIERGAAAAFCYAEPAPAARPPALP